MLCLNANMYELHANILVSRVLLLFDVPVNAYFGLLHCTLRGATFLNLFFLFVLLPTVNPLPWQSILGLNLWVWNHLFCFSILE